MGIKIDSFTPQEQEMIWSLAKNKITSIKSSRRQGNKGPISRSNWEHQINFLSEIMLKIACERKKRTKNTAVTTKKESKDLYSCSTIYTYGVSTKK